MSADAGPPLAFELHQVVARAAGRTVLQVEHLSARHGESIAVIGPNGAGKSTLLRLLSGFARPASGQLSVLGHRLDAPPTRTRLRQLRSQVGQVMQGLHLVGRLSVHDNVLIGSLSRVGTLAGALRRYPAEEAARAEAALRAVGLSDHAARRADSLSGGERQKAAIARLLVQAPPLILADEPTAALDPQAAGEICAMLRRASVHATLLTVIHQPSLIAQLADRVIGLRQGRIAFDRPAAEVDTGLLAQLYHNENAGPPAAREAGA